MEVRLIFIHSNAQGNKMWKRIYEYQSGPYGIMDGAVRT